MPSARNHDGGIALTTLATVRDCREEQLWHGQTMAHKYFRDSKANVACKGSGYSSGYLVEYEIQYTLLHTLKTTLLVFIILAFKIFYYSFVNRGMPSNDESHRNQTLHYYLGSSSGHLELFLVEKIRLERFFIIV